MPVGVGSTQKNPSRYHVLDSGNRHRGIKRAVRGQRLLFDATIPIIMVSERLQRQIERLLDEADQAISKEDWSTVASRARAVLRIDPDNSDALSYLAVAERDTGITQSTQGNPASLPVSAVVSDQPTSFSDGRYQVKRFLGEGGKKKVYLAQDTLLDREVAFALLKTEGLDDTSRTRIQREAQAMGRLGSHPHRLRPGRRTRPALHGHRTDGRR